MKKLYSLILAMLLLVAASSEIARAQYTINSYIVHKVDVPDPQGLGSGPNWHSIATMPGVVNDQTGELPYYGPVYEDEFCGYGHNLPFNVRFGNTQLTTANTFTITTCGAVILDPNWGATWLEEPLDGYNFIEMEPESNSATYYNYAYPEANENSLESEGSYGLFPNLILMPFALGYDYNYIPSESSNPTKFYYVTLGTTPNRELVIETDYMEPYQSSAEGFNAYSSYQVVIYESGISHFQYNYGPTVGNVLGYSQSYQNCPQSIGSGGSQFTFPGTWNYLAYVANEGSYLLVEDYGACVGMKMGANQYIQIDFAGNGWNANNQFAVAYNTPYGANGWPLLPDTAARLPQSSIGFFIAFPYDFTAGTISVPASEQPYNLNSPFTPTLSVSNSGSSTPTSAQVNLTISEVNIGQVYNQTVTLLATPTKYPITVATGSPGIFTTTSALGYYAGQAIQFSTTGTLPAPLSATNYYYVIPLTATTFEVTTNPGGGSGVGFLPLAITSAGSGTSVYSGANPAPFASAIVTFPPFTPGVAQPLPESQNGTGQNGYGIYEDTAIVFNLQPTGDQNPVDNTATDEWICSPANDIKTVSILNPPTGGTNGRSPIAVASPMSARFRNLGTVNQGATNPNGQTAPVPVTMIVKDPNGNVEYRDTVWIPNWPYGSTGGNSDGSQDFSSAGQGPGKGPYYDTAFAQWTPPELGIHTICAIALLPTDQLRADDTICGTSDVLPTDDAASVGIVNPQPDQEEPYGFSWQPGALFQSVGVADLFDVPVEVKIFRCSDGVMVFKADTSIPELNIDQGQVRLYFPAVQSPYNTATLAPGCYTICAYANLQSDGNPANDTACSQFSVIPRLSGNIYVGVGQRFQTIHAAVDSMKYRGIGGNLNLILTDASYTENGNVHASSQYSDLDFTGIAGLSANNIVTWEPLPGQTPVITFTGNRPSCMYFGNLFGGFMTFEGYNPLGVPIPDKVVAEPNKRGITIIDQRTVAGPVFDIEQGASNITMKDLVIHGNGFYADDSSSIVRLWNQANFTLYLQLVHDTVPINHIMVNNCELGNSKFGIRDDGLHDQFNDGQLKFIVWRNNSNTFTRNTIGTSSNPLSFAGIEFNNEQDFTVSHNEISNISTSLAGASGAAWNVYGILEPSPAQYQAGTINNPIVPGDTGNVVRCWINANRIKNITALTGGAYGIAIQQSVTIYTDGNPGPTQPMSTLDVLTQNRITNNMILDLFSKSASYPILMNTAGVQYSTDEDSIFNNSITTTNAATNITVQNSKHVFVWNNIIQNTGAGPYVNYAFSVPRPYAAAISSDYNLFDLHGNNTFAAVTEYDGTSPYTQFQVKTFLQATDWQSYLGKDVHSLQGNPLFGTPAMGVDSLHMPPALTYIESPAYANGLWLGTYSQKYDFDGDQRLTSTLNPSIGADEWDGFQYTNDLAVQVITQPKGFSATSDTILVTTDNPLWMTAVVKNMGSQTIFNRSVTATLQVALSGGPYNTIYSSTSAPMTWAVGQSQNVSFQGPNLTAAQATNGVFLLTFSTPNDQVNTNNVQTLTFRVLLKQNAVLVCYNGTGSSPTVPTFGTMNRDSVTQALNRLGVPFDLMDRNAPDGLANTTAIDYTPWWTIIWCEGTPTIAPSGSVGQGGLTFKEENELEPYLMAGQGYAKKSLVMAGQNIAYYAGYVN
jgi:hypothetical protein